MTEVKRREVIRIAVRTNMSWLWQPGQSRYRAGGWTAETKV